VTEGLTRDESLRTADGFAVSRRFGNLGGKKTPTGRNNPSTLSLTVTRWVSPQPLTLNHPASNPGCSSGWGSSFSGHAAARCSVSPRLP
jgi:hypothetical protein